MKKEIIIALFGVALLVTGCGDKKENTPEEAVTSFLKSRCVENESTCIKNIKVHEIKVIKEQETPDFIIQDVEVKYTSGHGKEIHQKYDHMQYDKKDKIWHYKPASL